MTDSSPPLPPKPAAANSKASSSSPPPKPAAAHSEAESKAGNKAGYPPPPQSGSDRARSHAPAHDRVGQGSAGPAAVKADYPPPPKAGWRGGCLWGVVIGVVVVGFVGVVLWSLWYLPDVAEEYVGVRISEPVREVIRGWAGDGAAAGGAPTVTAPAFAAGSAAPAQSESGQAQISGEAGEAQTSGASDSGESGVTPKQAPAQSESGQQAQTRAAAVIAESGQAQSRAPAQSDAAEQGQTSAAAVIADYPQRLEQLERAYVRLSLRVDGHDHFIDEYAIRVWMIDLALRYSGDTVAAAAALRQLAADFEARRAPLREEYGRLDGMAPRSELLAVLDGARNFVGVAEAPIAHLEGDGFIARHLKSLFQLRAAPDDAVDLAPYINRLEIYLLTGEAESYRRLLGEMRSDIAGLPAEIAAMADAADEAALRYELRLELLLGH